MTVASGRLYEAIRVSSDWPRRLQVPLRDVRAAWQQVAGLAATSPDSRRQLHDALHELSDEGQLTLPGGRHLWDGANPPLPAWVRLPRPPRPTDAYPRSFPWRPELGWLALERPALTDVEFDRFRQLQSWLAATHDRQPPRIPFRERSYQIFRDEKAYEKLIAVPRFNGERRLSLDLIRAEAPPLPAAAARIRSGPVGVAVMMENAHPFWTLIRYLRGVSTSPAGWVAYGGGNQAPASVTSLPELLGVPAGDLEVIYAGDLDAHGIDIARRVSEAAVAGGMSPVRPATWLYKLMLDVGEGQPTELPGWVDVYELASWLPPELRVPTADLLLGCHRISQEQITGEVLRDALDAERADSQRQRRRVLLTKRGRRPRGLRRTRRGGSG